MKKRLIHIWLFLGLMLLPLGHTVFAESPESHEAAQEEIPDNGIPVLALTIDPEEFQKVIESQWHEYQAENCTIRIDVPEGWSCEYGPVDEALIGQELRLRYFRGRGNSTWLEEKKPFKFRLEESADLLSMGANEHWVLMANAKDESLMRNRIISYIGDALGLAYTSKFVPVDLLVNGVYQGSYLLGEQVRIGENRIEIDKIKKSQTEEPEITGGYLLSTSPTGNDPEIGKLTLESGLTFLVESPEFDEYDEMEQAALSAQKAYIAAYLQQVEDAVFGKNAEGASVSDLMDLESAAKYWWVQTFSFNDEAFATTSSYLYKLRDGKLYWGPLWDFDRSLWLSERANFLNKNKMPWLDHLRAYDPAYQQLLRNSWEQLDAVLEELIREGGVLDRYSEEIRLSWEKDYVLWRGKMPMEGEFDAGVERIRQMITLRRKAIRESLDTQLTNVFVTVTFENEGKILAQEELYAGEELSEKRFPLAEEKKGYAFLHWADAQGYIFDKKTAVDTDMTVHAVYQEIETEAGSETVPDLPDDRTSESSTGRIVIYAAAAAAVLAGGIFFLRKRKS